ncbi:MAG: polysaccharide biosynthesis/export family protein, partial [Muribaculaceae bacterium]|nr:polysaccharide biosynthesis/export family protein [Muribaculaceae bacterium]
MEQIQRLKAQYQSGQITMMGGTSTTGKKSDSRLRGEGSSSTDSELGTETGMGMLGTGMTSGRSSLYSQNSLNARMNRNNRMLMQQMYANGNNFNSLYGLQNPYMLGNQFDDYLLLQNSLDENGKNIYGHDIFFNNFLTFEPNANMATPQDYRLGPGDEVIIDIWGASEDNIRQKISPDGSIIVSQLGPIYLNGMTVAQANNHVKNIYSKKYAVIGTDTDVNMRLGTIRT